MIARAHVLAIVAGAIVSGCGRFDFDPLAVAAADDEPPPADAATDASAIDTAASGITFVQEVDSDYSETATGSAPFTAAVGDDDLLIVALTVDGPTPTVTITDTFGDVYTQVEVSTAGPQHTVVLAYGVSHGSGENTVTVTLSFNANTAFFVHQLEYAGLAADPVDTVQQALGTATGTDAAETPPLVTSSPNELVFAFGALSNNGEQGTGFTERSDYQGDPTEDMIVAAPGSYPAKMSIDADDTSWTLLAVAFRGK